jgi:HPt (histidine-containing phosphotransfer) domain-containing protein
MSQACTELAILDLAILIEMYGDDSRETLESALSGFAAAAPPYINAIKEAGTARELTTLASAAHSLKSIAALTGATQLATLCRQLEQAARDADNQILAPLLVALPDCWQRLQQQLQQQRQYLRPDDV